MIKETGTGRYLSVASFRGLSTDIKPTNVDNGAEFLEIDTGDIYLFNEANHTWVKCAMYKPTDAQAEEYIGAWLDDHPEATTTVEDGSITVAKFASGVIDDTLAISGAAAEAKVTGDNIRNFNYLSGKVNLFDLSTAQNNKAYNANTGQEYTANGYMLSDYIPVIPNKTLYFSKDGTAASMNFVQYFDASKTFVSGSNYQTSSTVPSNASYVRVTVYGNTTNFAKLQVEYDEVTAFKGFVKLEDLVAVRIMADVTEKSANAFMSSYDSSANLFDVSSFTRGKQYNNAGSIIDSNTVGLSDYIPLIPNKTLYFTHNGGSIGTYVIYYMVEFDASKNWLRNVAVATSQDYTPSSDAVYARAEVANNATRFGVKISYGTDASWDKYVDRMTLSDHSVMATVNMFGSVAGIGDSYTAGATVNSGGTIITKNDQSYLGTMCKRAGVDCFNYGVNGATTRSYQTSTGGLPKALSDAAHDFYIFALGQNDINNAITVGTISDIHDEDYTLNADTFYGNYGKIIQQIKDHAPLAKMVMVKSWIDGTSGTSGLDYQSYDSAIAEIATHYSIPCISPFEDELFRSDIYKSWKNGGHPTTMGYSMMGLAMERLFSKCVLTNLSYFKYSVIG